MSDDDEDDDTIDPYVGNNASSQIPFDAEPALPEDEPHQFRPKPSLSVHMRCASHTINLIASTDFTSFIKQSATLSSQHSETINRCQVLWSLLRSPKKREIMIEYLGKLLTKPICVRWNSLFDSLALIVSLRDDIITLSEAVGITNTMQDSDFKYLEDYLNCTRPLIDTLNKLQGEKNCSYGYLLPCIITLRRKLLAVKTNVGTTFCIDAVDYLIERVEHRFRDFFEVEDCGKWAAIAAVIHPQFKTQWLGCLSIEAQKKVYSVVMTAATDAEAVVLSTTNTPNKVDEFFDFGNISSTTYSELDIFSNTGAQLQVKKYLHEPVTNNLLAVDVYPVVKKIFLKYNTPLPSSAAVERLFSYATMPNLPRFEKLALNWHERK
ncbi:uncharacterized protein [Eurosta solidaginis]|uniref:uncharacterized protein n=1 Tax=Eurosta solidaginis TaxID=178769 RepID=UPI0035315B06